MVEVRSINVKNTHTSPGDGGKLSRERDRDSTGRSGSRRSGAGAGGRGGGSVEQREQWEDPLATQPDRENELRLTNRGAGRVCSRVVPRVQSKLYILHKDGMELSHPESSAPLGNGSIPSREQSTVCC